MFLQLLFPLVQSDSTLYLQVSRWSKWGEIEFVGSKINSPDNPEVFGRLYLLGFL